MKLSLRTALALAAAAALLTGAGVATAAPKKLPSCAAWSDPAGDATPNGAGVGADSTLDITKVTFSVTAKTFTAKLAVPGYKDQHTASYGARFTAEMSIAGRAVIIYYQYSPTRDREAAVFVQQGMSVDGAAISAPVSSKVSGGEVTVSVPLKDLARAVGEKQLSAATSVSAPLAKTRGTYVALLNTFDTAAAPAETSFTFAPCS